MNNTNENREALKIRLKIANEKLSDAQYKAAEEAKKVREIEKLLLKENAKINTK